MADIIHLLPDSIANQIAAGEVIQRPASVIKELVENAIDAKATEIKIIIKDAGKSLIQIIDNGIGMSETDARLSFERHATSKIKQSQDLFALQTMGFRGEALASIAAISHVELKTKQEKNELGTSIKIHGSQVVKQEPIRCENGSNFIVKNLFYNVPARRKFLKSQNTEFSHIIEEFQRIVLTNENINFLLKHNDTIIYNLKSENKLQRIINVFKKNNINTNLIKLHTKLDIVTIDGYIGKPENSRKTQGHQYFFVNNRFMKHYYFYKAVTKAYQNLMPQNNYPSFFIYFTINPKEIDVNIHPTKTEIKFANEFEIWQVLNAAVREALGKYNLVPSIDFSNPSMVDIPSPKKSQTSSYNPKISTNPDYNPFNKNVEPSQQNESDNLENWDSIYKGLEDFDENKSHQEPIKFSENIENRFFQFKSKYILTSVKSGLMVINQKHAHQRILFEYYLKNLNIKNKNSQKLLYPEKIELSPKDFYTLKDLYQSLLQFGFEINILSEFNIEITSVPQDYKNEDIKKSIENIFEKFNNQSIDTTEEIQELIAIEIAKQSSIEYGTKLSQEEMLIIFDKLFNCESPNFTPNGKKIIEIIETDKIDKLFDK